MTTLIGRLHGQKIVTILSAAKIEKGNHKVASLETELILQNNTCISVQS